MRTLTQEQARAQLTALLDGTNGLSEPLKISGPRYKAVLVPESLWRGAQETLFLLSLPGLREDLKAGMQMSLSDCEESLDW